MKGKIRNKLRITVTILVVLLLLLVLYHVFFGKVLNQAINQKVENYVSKYGYLSVFVLSYIFEISPQPFVSAVVPIATGIALELNFPILLNWAILSVILSGLTSYLIGETFGKKFVMKFIDESQFKKYDKLFQKYGDAAMAIAAMTPVPYLPMIAGVFKMKISHFLIYGVLVRILHIFIFAWLFNVIL